MTLCHRCDGDRFIPADNDSNLLKPCPVCRPDTHAQWASGAYQPDHRPAHNSVDEPHTPDPQIVQWLGEMRAWLRGE